MIIKKILIRAFLFLVSMAQVSCATNQVNTVSGNELIGRSTWIEFSKSTETIFFYDPLQTFYSPGGDVTTVISGVKKNNSQTLMPSLVKVNCSNKMMQTYNHDKFGNWELQQDWKSFEGMALGILKNLCKNQGKVMLAQWESKNDPGTYVYLSWDYEVEYQPSLPGGKTYKFFEYKTSDKTNYYYYFISNCKDRTYATSNQLSLEKLNWQPEPSKNSPFSYLLIKACGMNSNQSTSGKSPSVSSAPVNSNQSTSIDDAKNKCSELGFKEKTEAFGRCVLKLTK